MKPKILPLPNGPYYLINDSTPTRVPNLQGNNGEPLSTVVGIALCRCGQSKNKPFCDGTHSTVGFSSKNNDNDQPVVNKRKSYVGSKITVHDNRAVCAHAKECVKNRLAFDLSARPWINPDKDTVESIIETVKSCPSGALSYSIGGVEYRDQTREPMVTVSKNGPYVITGGVELMGDSVFGEGASLEHYTLCRCGASKNKPFCDGTHFEVNFTGS
jgi:CDGSH-type Zn-finger protein